MSAHPPLRNHCNAVCAATTKNKGQRLIIMEKTLSLIVPVYNEEEVLKIASEALRGVLDDLIRKGKIAEDSFILFVNDGSKDRTWELIEEEHQAEYYFWR